MGEGSPGCPDDALCQALGSCIPSQACCRVGAGAGPAVGMGQGMLRIPLHFVKCLWGQGEVLGAWGTVPWGTAGTSVPAGFTPAPSGSAQFPETGE